jgi:hypothetical protein
MAPPRTIYVTLNTTIPLTWTNFRIKRKVFENLDKLGFFHIEGVLQGQPYQLIWNTHDQSKVEDKMGSVSDLSSYKVSDSIAIRGYWNILTRVVGSSVTNTVTVLMKEFSEPKRVEEDDDIYGVERASIYLNKNNDVEILAQALVATSDLQKAKIKVEEGSYADIAERLIHLNTLKRPADEPAGGKTGSRPRIGLGTPPPSQSRSGTPSSRAGTPSSTDQQVPGATNQGSQYVKQETPDRNLNKVKTEPGEQGEDREYGDHANGKLLFSQAALNQGANSSGGAGTSMDPYELSDEDSDGDKHMNEKEDQNVPNL